MTGGDRARSNCKLFARDLGEEKELWGKRDCVVNCGRGKRKNRNQEAPEQPSPHKQPLKLTRKSCPGAVSGRR